MSEHTPLTEADLAAIITAEVAGLHAETAGAATAIGKHLAGVLAARLAARTSTATADTGLRERVEALLSTWVADDEESLNTFGQHLMGGAVISCAEHLRAILDATAAPTTDTGACDE